MDDELAPRALVVDDEEVIRRLLGRALEALGYRVVAASNGQEALDRYRETPDIEVVFLDLLMPVMDGFECAERLIETWPSCRVIICSGTLGTAPVLPSGTAGTLHKPFRVRDVRGVLEEVGVPVPAPDKRTANSIPA